MPPIKFSTFGIMHKFASIISQLNNIWVGSSMQDTHEPRSWTVLTFPWNTRVHQTPHIALAAYFWGYHAILVQNSVCEDSGVSCSILPIKLKADRPHPRYYPHTPPDYRHTDKHLRLVMTFIALCPYTVVVLYNVPWVHPDGRTDATKYIISLASRSIIFY